VLRSRGAESIAGKAVEGVPFSYIPIVGDEPPKRAIMSQKDAIFRLLRLMLSEIRRASFFAA
jgi:hypothetical protein